MYVLMLAARTEGLAHAHTLGISSGEYRVTPRGVSAHLSFAVVDGARLDPLLDADRDGRVSSSEAARGRDTMVKALADRVIVRGDGHPCAPSITDLALTEGDGLLIELAFVCEDAPREVDVDVAFFDVLGTNHRHVARTVGDSTADTLLTEASRRVTFRAKDAELAPPAPASTAWRWVVGALVLLAALALSVALSSRREKTRRP